MQFTGARNDPNAETSALPFPNLLLALGERCIQCDEENRAILLFSVALESNVCRFCQMKFWAFES